MRHPNLVLALGATLLSAACQAGGDVSNAALDTDDQKASYAIGLDMGRNLQPAESRIDMDALMRGVHDAMAGAEPAVDREELNASLQVFSQAIQEEQATRRDSMATANAEAGQTYQAENAQREGVQVTESGLQFEVLEEGEGETLVQGQRALLHYTGTLVDGTEFDTSRDGDPVEFTVGQLIPGFNEAMTMMREGGSYRFVIPSEIGYGPQGSGGPIGPNATLVFEVEIIEALDDQG